ncbi:MAG TPA: SurA N-terminal domain-containing protein, partial [Gallionella sp.]
MRIIIPAVCCVLLAIHTGSIAATAQAKAEKARATSNEKRKFDPQQQVSEIDAVVAVANNEVITQYELDQRVSLVAAQLSRKNIPLPPLDVLERQLLERMIMEKLQMQFANESGVRVDDAQLDQAITRIAQSNGFSSIAEFRAKRLDADG